MVHCERHGISFLKGHHFCARLHTRTLLDKKKFAARKIPIRFRQQNGVLDRKDVFAVEVLMKAVVVAGAVLKQQRRRPELASPMATPNKIGMLLGITHTDL